LNTKEPSAPLHNALFDDAVNETVVGSVIVNTEDVEQALASVATIV
jgi:hypothetical protein